MSEDYNEDSYSKEWDKGLINNRNSNAGSSKELPNDEINKHKGNKSKIISLNKKNNNIRTIPPKAISETDISETNKPKYLPIIIREGNRKVIEMRPVETASSIGKEQKRNKKDLREKIKALKAIMK